MDDKLTIGIVTKPQGIKGEIKVKLFADDIASVSNVTEVFIDGVNYKILSKRSSGEDLFLSLRGIADRNDAETLRGKEIFADREQIEKDEDSYFIVDVLGCEVYLDDGQMIGKVSDILTGRTDVYYVKGQKTAVFPMIKDLKPIFDIKAKRITLDGARFKEVVFYED